MDGFELVVQGTVPKLEESLLPELLCSKRQMPDLGIRLKEDTLLGTFMEVHSSPYSTTIYKTLLVAVDLFRLRRMYYPTTLSVTGFAFPKLPPLDDANKINISSVWWKLK